MRVVLTPTISVDLPANNKPRKGNFMSDMRLVNINTEHQVNAGDVVRYGNKPHFIQHVGEKLVTIKSMDERGMFIQVKPEQIGCVFEKGGMV